MTKPGPDTRHRLRKKAETTARIRNFVASATARKPAIKARGKSS